MTLSSGAAGCGDKRPQYADLTPVAVNNLRTGPYQGVLPCADCEGLRYRLDLFEDRVFFLRISYLGKSDNPDRDDIGTWSISSDEPTLNLHGGSEGPVSFRIIDDDVLRKLDLEGHEIVSGLNYELVWDPELPPLEPHLLMTGMYRYMADAAVFVECRTGRRLAVAFEADSISLERAYLEARELPGEALLITVEGRIAARPAMEGDGTTPSLVVDRFVGIWPGDTCDLRSACLDGELNNRPEPWRPQ